ncbi:MAG TPA: rRNA maturation RNase YbeY [Candidatus Paceibacterota bacterium]|nr:rRNA maturation RNase YbeY [Candidatus Paceibacterota bacterium]
MISAAKEKILQKKLENLFFKIMEKTPILAKKARGKGKPEVFLLGDAEMRRIKKKFLPREKGPANVLSFGEPAGWPHPESRISKLGEIYLNLDLTKGEMGKLAPLFLHGILHILGYDHKKKNDRIKMEKLEKNIVKKLDIS